MTNIQSSIRPLYAWWILLFVAVSMGSAQSWAAAGPNPPVFTGATTSINLNEDDAPVSFSLGGLFDRGEPLGGFFGGDFALSYEIASPTSPGGIAIADIGGFFPSLTITAIPDANGTTQFTLRAIDSSRGVSTEVDFTINVNPVNDPPQTSGSLPPLTIIEDLAPVPAVDVTVAFSDIDDAALTYSIVSRTPAVGIVDASIAGSALSLTTLFNEFGQVDFVIRATDSAGEFVDTTFALAVTPEPDPPRVVNPAGPQTVLEDEPAVRVILSDIFEDDDDPTLNFSIESVTPAGILNPSIIGSDLVLTQVEHATGLVTVNVRATDSDGMFADTAVQLTITPVNDAPIVVSASNSAIHTEDTPGTLTADASAWFDEVDVGDTLSFEILSVSGDSIFATSGVSGGGAVSYTLIPNAFGAATITIQVTDGGGLTALASLAVTVTPENDPPFVAQAPVDVFDQEDVGSLTVDLSAVFDDEDITTAGDTITLSLVSNAVSALGDVSVSGTQLTLASAPNANGTTTVTVEAADSFGLTTQADFDITLAAVNDPPVVAVPVGSVSFFEDQADAAISLAGVFDDVDLGFEGDNLSLSVIGNTNSALVTNVALVGGNSLNLTLSPNGDGVASLVVEARDSAGASVTETIEVTVTILEPIAQDDAPAAIQENDGLDTSNFVPFEVLLNDQLGDPDTVIISAGRSFTIGGQTFENRSESEPVELLDPTGIGITVPNGTVDIVNNGRAILYIPKPDFSGTDFFTYTIQDADGDTSTARVDIVIDSINDAPIVISEPLFELEEASVLDVAAEGGLTSFAFDPEGDPISVLVVEVPDASITAENGFVLNTDGSFSWTPDPSFTGPAFFRIQFSDGDLVSPVTVISLIVTPRPPPAAPPPSGEVEFQLNLANNPLEESVASEANVLVVMDDSGSMDWDLATDQGSGVWVINNANTRDGVPQRSRLYLYANDFDTNVFNTRPALPAAESLDGGGPPGFTSTANPVFAGNDYGLWRIRNAQYNTVYYNPEIDYRPWRGLNRNATDFPDSNPTAAILDPYDALVRTIDLTAGHSWTSNDVPAIRNDGNGLRTVQNVNVYLPHYYSTPVVGRRPDANDPHTRVDILPGATYPGGDMRFDCGADGSSNDTCTYAQEIQNFANWFTYYRTREYTAKAVLGSTIASTSNLRMGYAVLNNSNRRERINSLNSSFRVGHKADLLDQVYATSSSGGTPLRRALDRAGRHFECEQFDSFGSTSATAPGNPNCPILPAPEGQCQSNFALLFSDGEWNGNDNTIPTTSRGDHDSATNVGNAVDTAFDGGVYQDNLQTTLADIAMFYYERDLHPAIGDGVPTLAADLNQAPAGSFDSDDEVMHQHMKTYTIGFGVTGNVELTDLPSAGLDPVTGDNLVDFTQTFAWGDPSTSGPAKIDDMLHAALNGRGEFLQANNPVVLERAFQEAFEDFSDGSSSVSAVAFNSSQLRAGTVEYRGFFNLGNNTGDLQAIELLDGATGLPPLDPIVWSAAEQLELIPANNRVIATFDRIAGQGTPFRFDQLNADQQLVLNQQEVDYIRGDRSLEEPTGGFRARETILGDLISSAPQSVDRPNRFRRDREPFPISTLYSSFQLANENRQRVVYIGGNDGMLHAFDAGRPGNTPIDQGTGAELFAYVPNKLIDSSQRFSNRLDLLSSLVYSHRFFVDLTPAVDDVFISPNGLGTPEWRTVIIGGLRGGGKGYFALDITDPAQLASSEANLADAVLWEFTDEDDTYPLDVNGNPVGGSVGAITDLDGAPVRDLGFTYSRARTALTNVQRTGPNPENRWAAIFGNGYNSTSGIATLFALFIGEGHDGWQNGDFVKVSTGNGVIPTNPGGVDDPMAGIPNGLGEPTLIDSDLTGTVDLAYAGDLHGNLYRFEIGDPDPANWRAVLLFTATNDGTLATRRPITVAPEVIRHPTEDGFMVIFGTGSFIADEDGESTEIESVYGIWDRFEDNPVTADPDSRNTRLVEQTITNLIDPTFDFAALRIMSDNPVNYVPDVGLTTGTYGWVIDLDVPRPTETVNGDPNPSTAGQAPPAAQFPGERAIRRIIQRGNTLILTTVIPRDANSCNRAPPGAIWFVDLATGGNPLTPTIDLDNDGTVDDADLVLVDGKAFVAGFILDGSGSLVDPGILGGSGATDFLVINTSGGDGTNFGSTGSNSGTDTIATAKTGSPKEGRLAWWEILEN